MHAVCAPVEIDDGGLTAQIACMILNGDGLDAAMKIMQATRTGLEIDKDANPYEPPA
jgi:hypothetical protein